MIKNMSDFIKNAKIFLQTMIDKNRVCKQGSEKKLRALIIPNLASSGCYGRHTELNR